MNTMRFPSPEAKAVPIGTRCEKPTWFERRTSTEYQALYAERRLNAQQKPPRDEGADIHTAIGLACFAGILIMVALLALHIL